MRRLKNTWLVSIQHLKKKTFDSPGIQPACWSKKKNQLPPPNASANVTARWILGVDVPTNRRRAHNLRPSWGCHLAHLASKNQQTFLNKNLTLHPPPKKKGAGNLVVGSRTTTFLGCFWNAIVSETVMTVAWVAQPHKNGCPKVDLKIHWVHVFSYTCCTCSSQGHPFQTKWSLGIRMYISTNSPEATLQVSPHSVSLRAFHLTGIDWEPYRVPWSLSISFGCQVGRPRSSRHQDSKKWAWCVQCLK